MKKGYAVTEFDNTGMFEIQKVDEDNLFKTDGEAVEQAVKDGIKIIPVKELPENFERRYSGWIDTPENRDAIKEYCRKKYIDMKKRCPKCGGTMFIVTQHVAQSVVVDGNGYFVKEVSSCDEIIHAADDEDIWTCEKCGHSMAGAGFNVKKQ